jgi:hypothetical protein
MDLGHHPPIAVHISDILAARAGGLINRRALKGAYVTLTEEDLPKLA